MGTTADQLDAAVADAKEFDPHAAPKDATAPCPASGKAVPRECEFLKKPALVRQPPGTFSKRRAPHRSSAIIDSTYTFRGDTKPRPCTEQMVVVKGRTIYIIRPNDGSMNGKNAPTNDQIANSLAALDERQLDSMDNVVVNPNKNPDDAYWAQKKNNPNFSSAASAGPRTIDYYPLSAPPTQDTVDSDIQHESGHEFAQQQLGSADQDKWKDAIAADKDGVSTYGDTSKEEDFAEFSEMYAIVRGTKCEKTLQQLYPNRYPLMKDFMNRPIKKRQPPPQAEPQEYQVYDPFEEKWVTITPPGAKTKMNQSPLAPDELVDPFKE